MLNSLRPSAALALLNIARLLGVACTAAFAAAAQEKPLDHAARAKVVQRIGAMLEERYVFPEVAKMGAAQLAERLRSGGFDGGHELRDEDRSQAFAAALTAALRDACKDEHLLVRVRKIAPIPAPTPAAHPILRSSRRAERDRARKFGFQKLEQLEGNVGYLELRAFVTAGGAIDVAVGAVAMLASSDAIIFDLRENEGGSPGMVQFLCSHLFEEPTHLNSLYFREGDRTQEFWTHGVPGAPLPDVPVFILTSAKTFSAAEEFSYNLQAQGRATIVGETTRGGAHPGGLYPIDDRFEMVIPTGRAINPITGTNWEGVGVVPDVKTTADVALDAALKLARPAAVAHRSARNARWDRLEAMYLESRRLDDAGQSVDAAARMVKGLEQGRTWRLLNEGDINRVAHDLIGEGRDALGLSVFTFNRDAFPDSDWARDELERAKAPKAPASRR